MSSKSLLAALAGGVTLFLLGWLFYGVLLMDFFEANAGIAENVMRGPEDMNLLLVFLGEFVTGVLLAFIFTTWASISTFSGGLRGGAILGFLFSLALGLTWLGTSYLMTPVSTVVDVLVTTVRFAIAGGVIGYVLGTGKKAAQSAAGPEPSQSEAMSAS